MSQNNISNKAIIGENVKVQIIRSTITSLLKKEEVKK